MDFFLLLNMINFFSLIVSCGASYLKLGCYNDIHARGHRPLPNLLFTDRDPKSQKFSGKRIDWENLDSYMKDIVCRCAEQAKAQDYMFFGVQFYGMIVK